ncbi:MAG: DUF6265 family protein [Planctomycetota bacterium]
MHPALLAIAITTATTGLSANPTTERPGISEPAQQPHDALALFAPLIGTWSTPVAAGPPMQETWMPAHGNNITGALRWYAEDGTVRLYELMTITSEPDAVRLRIRHFDRDMNPWKSEADGPLVLKLTRSGGGVLHFEAETGTGSLESMTYDLSDPGSSTVTLGFEGDQQNTIIRFRRIDG